MTNLRLSFIAVLLVVSATLYAFASDSDFDGLVSDVAHRYDAHATRIPMMGLVSLCARFATHGGVKGLRVVEFDDVKDVYKRQGWALCGGDDRGAETGPGFSGCADAGVGWARRCLLYTSRCV